MLTKQRMISAVQHYSKELHLKKGISATTLTNNVTATAAAAVAAALPLKQPIASNQSCNLDYNDVLNPYLPVVPILPPVLEKTVSSTENQSRICKINFFERIIVLGRGQ